MKSVLSKIVTILLALSSSGPSKESGYVFTHRAFTEDKTWVYEVPAGTGPQITMCWESGASNIVAPNGLTYDFTTIRSKVRSAVEAQWQRYAKVYFWWKTTHSDPNCDVKIRFYSSDDELGIVKGGVFEGYHDLYLNIDWMVPIQESTWRAGKNKGPREWWNSATMTKRKDTQYGFLQETALHEFGHVLGFAHEHLRTKEGKELYGYTRSDLGDKEIGAYDKFSIMNYFRLYLSNSLAPTPKLSCGDVASARVLYGPNPAQPNAAPKCNVDSISKASSQALSDQQLTSWVADTNINTSAKSLGASDNIPVVHALPGNPISAEYVANVAVQVVPSSNPPGYTLTLSLKDPNFENVSCNSPVRISNITLYTIEKSWNHGTICASEYDDCSWPSLPEISLSSCNPTFTAHIPRGKGNWSEPNTFVYEDCSWKNEDLLGWMGETITFGTVIRNGDYVCVERNGIFSEVSFLVNGKGAGFFELPFTLDRAMAFYPLITESARRSEVPLTLNSEGSPRQYLMESFETTQGSYYSVTGRLPSGFIGIASRPVEQVTWFDAIVYCNKRSIKEGLNPVYSYSAEQINWQGACIGLTNLTQDISKNGYRLPTVDEWVLASKAGAAAGSCPWVPTLPRQPQEYAWYLGNSNNATHPVGLKKPNNWGLYDMSGNVEEWVWGESNVGAAYRVAAGGGFHNEDYRMCHYTSGTNLATVRKSHIGFRVMRRAADLIPPMMLLLD